MRYDRLVDASAAGYTRVVRLGDYLFYLRFYLPLALIGLLWLSGNLATNFVLLSHEQGIAAFATFTLAQGLMAPVHALFVFVPQMSTVMGRSRQGRIATFRFIAMFAGGLAAALAIIALTPIGSLLIHSCYDIDANMGDIISGYLLALSPWLLIEALGKWGWGQLIQAGRTVIASSAQGAALATQVGLLAWGFSAGWPPMHVIIISMLAGSSVMCVGNLLSFLRWGGAADEASDDTRLGTFEIARYFLPMASTSLCFALGKVSLLALLTRSHPGDAAATKLVVASFGLLMSLNMLFNLPVNHLRHCFTTYGNSDPQGVRLFHRITSMGIVCLALIFVLTPAAHWYFSTVQGAAGAPLARALAAAPIIVLFPIAIAYRSYAQGWAMARKRTGMMALAAAARLTLVLGCAATLLHYGLLGEASAAVILALGFALEAIVVGLGNRNSDRNSDADTDADADGQAILGKLQAA